jgi:opacity protein-like surface antigen
MKKLFLTAVVALSTLAASAQFMVVTTYDGDQEENADKITANMGFGFAMNNGITVGIVKNGEEYDIWGRYDLGSYMDGAYVSFQAPTEDASDNMSIGLGYSLNVWNSLYIEPNYSMPVSEDEDGEREGSFNIGIGYRF